MKHYLSVKQDTVTSRTEKMVDWMEITKFSLEGVVLPIVGVLGVVGNVASIAVLQAR